MYVPASMLKKNEEIILEPMSIIPCDCFVLEGTTVADESTMTGESFPVAKEVGDFLLSGTRNISNRVVAVVTAEQQESSLARLIESISSATEQTSNQSSFLDVMTTYFVTAILFLSCLSFANSFLINEGLLIEKINIAAQRAMAVLAASCPCALGLASPSATMAGIDAAWAQGALLMGGERTLKDLSSITHVVMDKTGTLTRGQLQVTACHLKPGIDQAFSYHLLYLAERGVAQSHPAGKAVFQWALQQLESSEKTLLSNSVVTNLRNTPGKGVSCVISHTEGTCHTVHVGTMDFLREADVHGVESLKHAHESPNSVMVYFAFDEKYAGYLMLQVWVYHSI
jgi:Cu+-exporting ATPase